MAMLASYMLNKAEGETLPDYLDNKVFRDAKTFSLKADEADVRGFNEFLVRYKKALDVERAACDMI